MNIRNYAILLTALAIISPQLSTHVVAQTTTDEATAQKTESEYDKAMAEAKRWSDAPSRPETPQQRSWRYVNAGKSYERAGDNAPDDAKKYEAYMKAGKQFELARTVDYTNTGAAGDAFKAYEKATKVASLSGEQKAKAQVEMADAARLRDWVNAKPRTAAVGDRIRALYQAALDTPGADKESRIHAQKYIGYMWNEQGENLKGALAFETLSNWPGLSEYEQMDALNGAVYALGDDKKTSANPQIVALLDKLFPRIIKLEKKPEEQANRYVRWGERLVSYGNVARAYAVWTTLADDNKASHEHRAHAIEKIAAQRSLEKQPQLALKAWERSNGWTAPPVPPTARTNAPYLNWAHRRAMSRAEAYLVLGDEAKLRAELQAVVALAQNNPGAMWHARYNVGASYKREADKLRKVNANPSTAVKAQITAKEKAAATELEAVLNADAKAVAEATLYEAALERAQIEADNKNYVKARGWLVLASEKMKSTDVAFGPRNSYVMPLMKASAGFSYQEKNYKDAVDALINGLSYQGKADPADTQLVFDLWRESVKEKQWEQARSILARLKAYGLPDTEYHSASADMEVQAQNWKAAADAAVLAEELKLNEAQKKKVTDAIAKIPAEIMTKARSDRAAAKVAPKPAPAPYTGGGFLWF